MAMIIYDDDFLPDPQRHGAEYAFSCPKCGELVRMRRGSGTCSCRTWAMDIRAVGELATVKSEPAGQPAKDGE